MTTPNWASLVYGAAVECMGLSTSRAPDTTPKTRSPVRPIEARPMTLRPLAQREHADRTATVLMGGVIVPALLTAIYGVVELFRHGVGPSLWPTTYLPLVGGLAAIAALPVHIHTAKAPDSRSWLLAAGSLAVFIPYLLSLYVMGFLGAWAIYHAVTSHPLEWGHALFGVLWVLVGWRMLFKLHELQTHLIQTAKTIGLA